MYQISELNKLLSKLFRGYYMAMQKYEFYISGKIIRF